MRAWLLLFGFAALLGLGDAGLAAFSILAEPYRAEAVANQEAVSRGIKWPLELRADNQGRHIWYFTYCNPRQKSDNVEITVKRDDSGALVATLPEKDQEKWPRQNAASR